MAEFKSLLKNRLKNKEYYPLYLILAVNVIYFALVIACYPGFETDDYLLFSLIKNNPYPVAVNPYEAFFFFLRPVSYFTFYIDSIFWLYSPVMMKAFSLLLHLIFTGSFYLLLYKGSALFNIKFNRVMAGVVLLLLTFHPDVSIWIIWIANRTELLYMLFYSLSLLSAAEYLLKKRQENLYLYAYAAFYLLSILSKAQPLHLPLLILLAIWVLREKFDKEKISAIKKVSLALTVIAILFVAANFMLFSQKSVFFQYLYKKPFLMAGVLLYSVFPFWAENIYSFFVHNKLYALTAVITAASAAVVYLRKERMKRKYAGYLIVFLLIIFIPRITLDPINRINSIQIFWVFTALYFIGNKYYHKMKSAIIFTAAAYFSISVFYNIVSYGLHKKYIAENMAQIDRFNNRYDLSKEKIVVLTALNNVLVPSQTYYNKNGAFGSYDIMLSPVYVFHQMYSWKGLKATPPLVKIRVDADICTIENPDPEVKLYGNFAEGNRAGFSLVDMQKFPDSQSMKLCRIRIPQKYLHPGYKLVYYDGEQWKEL
ncbi:MAG: hypothetical protein ACM3Q2_11560 [Syntrophothermus sp.]